jgi:DNA-binding NarL/FixJ family response regulator
MIKEADSGCDWKVMIVPPRRSVGRQLFGIVRVEPLTARELDVLGAIRDGATNSEIAASLGIAVSTVKRHVEHILVKLDARNRTQAVTLYRDTQLSAARIPTRHVS